MNNTDRIIEGKDYPIFIGETAYKGLANFLTRCKYEGCKAYILVDENTRKYCLPVLQENVPGLRNAKYLR